MQSHSSIRCFKLVTKNVRKGPQFPFVIHDHCQIFDIFLAFTISFQKIFVFNEGQINEGEK